MVDLTDGIKIGNACAFYQVTSPPAVVSGIMVVGSSIGDNCAADLERGVVRPRSKAKMPASSVGSGFETSVRRDG